ncbi:Spc98 family-domain-containing protein [Chytriomyces sp. MP71]|nr:Spc98 family-domain-containing protein [Chytriomyces sp. MP71]
MSVSGIGSESASTESFRIEALAAELLASLGIKDGSASVEQIAGVLRQQSAGSAHLHSAASISSAGTGTGTASALIQRIAGDPRLSMDEQHALLARFSQLNATHSHQLGAFVSLIDNIKRDPSVARLLSLSQHQHQQIQPKPQLRGRSGYAASTGTHQAVAHTVAGTTAGRVGVGRVAALAHNHIMSSSTTPDAFAAGGATPKRTRSASVSATLTPGGFANMGSVGDASSNASAFLSHISAISGTPSMSMADPTLVNTPMNMSRRRSSSHSRTIKKQSSKISLDDPNASLKCSIKSPFESRQPKTAAFLNKNIREAITKPIGHLSLVDQESFILEDLLFALLGMDGVYIKKRPLKPSLLSAEEDGYGPFEYSIDPTLDTSLSSLVSRILPAAAAYLTITHFATIHSRAHRGSVAHALAAALRALLKEYTVFVAQLEHQMRFAPGFGAHKMWVHLVPTLNVLEVVMALVRAVREAEAARAEELGVGLGGVLLGVIADRCLMYAGDATARHVYAHLLKQASIPYFRILHTWIRNGRIVDPYDEFLVQERKGLTKTGISRDFNDAYWEQRYTVRGGGMPVFLEGIQEKILLAGKYLNVVAECGVDVDALADNEVGNEELGVAAFGDVVRVVDDGRFVQDVEKAYRVANRALLDLLFKENRLLDRLKSLKHYFLLDAADFLIHFMDLASPELTKPSQDVSVDTLTSMLELLLRNPSCSVSYLDSFKDDITIEMSSYSLVEQLLKVTSLAGVDYRDVFVEGQDGNIALDLRKVQLGSGETVSSGFGAESDKDLLGIDAMTLGYSASFPTSLIINKRVITKYQLLFRHLLHCKNVERLLTGVWAGKAKYLRLQRRGLAVALTNVKKRDSAATAKSVKRSGSISSLGSGIGGMSGAPKRVVVEDPSVLAARQHQIREDNAFLARISVVQSRMLTFVQQFLHFLSFDVIEPNWISLEKTLAVVQTVEEVQRQLTDFLDTCLKDCLLTNQKLLKHFGDLMTVCTDFAAFANEFLECRFDVLRNSEDKDDVSLEDYTSTLPRRLDFSDTSRDSFADVTLSTFEEKQVVSMREFIDALQFADSLSSFDNSSASVVVASSSTAVLQDLVTRIDYNLYYSRTFADGIGLRGGGGGLVGGSALGGERRTGAIF